MGAVSISMMETTSARTLMMKAENLLNSQHLTVIGGNSETSTIALIVTRLMMMTIIAPKMEKSGMQIQNRRCYETRR